MDKALLRTCFRTSPRSIFRCQQSSAAAAASTRAAKTGSVLGSRCLASAICPARDSASSIAVSNNAVVGVRRVQMQVRNTPTRIGTQRWEKPGGVGVVVGGRGNGRGYASTTTSESTREGTVEKGREGVRDEGARQREGLVVPEHLNEKEREIWELLDRELNCTSLEVQDISGGCGSMYGIDIVSEKFRGLSMLKQQRLVNEVLKGEIGRWHGVQLKTKAP